MKTIIAGSRGFANYQLLVETMRELGWSVREVVSGGARGADTLGERYAAEHNIPLIVFPAAWETWGRSAGYVRNQQMADYAKALVAFWDGISKGTAHMIRLAENKKLKVRVVKYGPDN